MRRLTIDVNRLVSAILQRRSWCVHGNQIILAKSIAARLAVRAQCHAGKRLNNSDKKQAIDPTLSFLDVDLNILDAEPLRDWLKTTCHEIGPAAVSPMQVPCSGPWIPLRNPVDVCA